MNHRDERFLLTTESTEDTEKKLCKPGYKIKRNRATKDTKDTKKSLKKL